MLYEKENEKKSKNWKPRIKKATRKTKQTHIYRLQWDDIHGIHKRTTTIRKYFANFIFKIM